MSDAAAGSVRVIGSKQLRASLKRAGLELDDLKAVNAAVAQLVAAAAASRAPQRSGRLAGSIRGNRAVSRARVMAGGSRLPYAGPIHWGWPARSIEANPFIRAAAVATEPAWTDRYERGVAAVLGKVRGA